MSEPTAPRIDHLAAAKRVIDHAIGDAVDARVPARELISYLTWWARRLDDQAFRNYKPPRMHDQHGRPIDFQARQAEADRERERKALERDTIPPEQRVSAWTGRK